MEDILKLCFILAAMTGLIMGGVNAGVTLFVCAFLLGWLFGLGFGQIMFSIKESAADMQTIELVSIILLITVLGNVLLRTERIKAIASSIEYFAKDIRVAMAAVPAFIGLLPMPGGALISAPMTGQLAEKVGASAESKTVINYWFRHVWEYIFPLYPGIILSAAVFEVPVSTISLANILFTPAALISGFIFCFGGPGYDISFKFVGDSKENLRNLFFSVWPVASVIGLYLILGIGLIPSLLLTLSALYLINKGHGTGWKRILVDSARPDLVILVFGVMAFKKVVADSGSVDALPESILGMGLPTEVMLFSVPFIAGLLTGITIGYVGVVFPLILSVIGTGESFEPGYFMIAYVGGYLGVLASPVHLCLVLTRDYYGADMRGVYFRLFPLIASVMCFLAFYYCFW